MNVIDPSPDIVREHLCRPLYQTLHEPGSKLYRKLLKPFGRSGYKTGMDPKVRKQLEQMFLEDVNRLENMTGRDLSHWFECIDPG